jgi:hypothetical protein
MRALKGEGLELAAKGVYTLDMAAKRSQRKTVAGSVRQRDAVQAAIDYGIDISMLIDNLRRSPAERIRRHQIALNGLIKAKKAMKRPRDKEAILQLEAMKKLNRARRKRQP